MRHLVIGVIAFSILSLPTSPAFAYKLLGGKWPNNIVTALYYNDISSYETAVEDAADDWSDESIKPNLYEVPHPGDHFVGICDVNNKWYIAATQLFPDPESTYDFAIIRCNTDKMGSLHPYQQYIIAHEFGHVLGLAHVNNKWVLMHYTTEAYDPPYNVRGPKTDDVNGVNAIYGAP